MGFSALANPAVLVLLYTTWAALQTQGIDKDCDIPDRYRNKAPDYSSFISPTVSTLLWPHQMILWLSTQSVFSSSEPSPAQFSSGTSLPLSSLLYSPHFPSG